MDRERRRVPRFQFIAPAEVADETSGARTKMWVADLGSLGCSLKGGASAREGAAVRVRIGVDPRETFQARATVVYSRADRVGLHFNEVKPASSRLLNKWLATAKFPKPRLI